MEGLHYAALEGILLLFFPSFFSGLRLRLMTLFLSGHQTYLMLRVAETAKRYSITSTSVTESYE